MIKTLNPAQRYAMYLRKSRDEERLGLEETLRKHKAMLLQVAASLHITVAPEDIFEEVVSGESIFARPEMIRLLEAIENETYAGVLCVDIDRLGRGGMRDQGIILDAFKYSGTKIITPEKTYDLNDELDEEVTEFKTFMSRREYKIITKRLRRGLMQTIEDGGYTSNAPYGYDKATVNKKPTLAINEEEARIVRYIFDRYCEGVGCSTIAREVNAMGAKPHRGTTFSRSTVGFILRNNVYIGKIVWNKKSHIRKGRRGNDKHITIYNPKEEWTVVDGLHPPIVSEEQYNRAQEIMQSRYIPSCNDGTVKSQLAGLVWCRECGKRMQRMGSNKGVAYILCPTTGCVAGAKAEYVEEAVLSYLRQYLADLEIEIRETRPARTKDYAGMIQLLQAEIDKAAKQKGRLQDLLETGVYDVETYRERIAVLDERIAAAQGQIARLRSEEEQARGVDKQRQAEEIRKVIDAYPDADAAGKNRLLKSVIQKITYYKAKKTKPRDFELAFDMRLFYSSNV